MSQPPISDAPDREVCLCFHVPLGKLVKFIARRRPQVASQLCDCHGAGTGCGWCVPFLERLHEQTRRGEPVDLGMSIEEYRERRLHYHRTKKPVMPPPVDADGPIALDLEGLLDEIPDDLKLD
jgi:bacterioferritin-associated ferredoxin